MPAKYARVDKFTKELNKKMDKNTDDKKDAAENEQELTVEEAFEAMQNEIAALNDKYLREAAELENVKRRAIKERSELIKYAGEGIIRDLLDIFDSLKLAVSQETPKEAKGFVDGVKGILQQFENTLAKHSVRSEDSAGKQFDPNKHEAVAIIPTGDKEPGTIIQEYKSLFFYKDKLLRPAQVVVAKERSGE